MHAEPIALAIVAAVVLALLLGAFFAARRNSREFAGIIWMPVLVLSIATVVVMVPVVWSTESHLDARDAAIQQRLQQSGIQLVHVQGGDNEAVVSKAGCEAAFRIEDDETTSYDRTWPLVNGTGHVLSGCAGVQLDELFGPQA